MKPVVLLLVISLKIANQIILESNPRTQLAVEAKHELEARRKMVNNSTYLSVGQVVEIENTTNTNTLVSGIMLNEDVKQHLLKGRISSSSGRKN
ncbi:hypothetical protein Bca101_021770 [Brassica carinata]